MKWKMKNYEVAAVQAKIQYHQSCITYWQGILLSGPSIREFMVSGSHPDVNVLNKMNDEQFKSHCIQTMKLHLEHIQKCVTKLETFGLKPSVLV